MSWRAAIERSLSQIGLQQKPTSLPTTDKRWLSVVYRFFAPPVFDEPTLDRAARWTNALILLLMGLALLLLGQLPFNNLPLNIATAFALGDVVVIALTLAAWLLLRRGRLRAAALIVLFIWFGSIIYTSLVIFQTIRTPMVIGYVIVIPMSGLLLGRKAVSFFVAMSCIALVAVFSLEWIGDLSQRLQHPLQLMILLYH
jgi:hypothetical protein